MSDIPTRGPTSDDTFARAEAHMLGQTEPTNLPISQEAHALARDFADWHEGFKTLHEVEQLAKAFQRAMTQADAAGYRRGVEEAAGTWQPIETAPKGDDPAEENGPPILIWQEGWPTGYEGFWYANGQAWFFGNTDSEYGDDQYPTHWQPLPEPPAIRVLGMDEKG